MCVYVNVDIVTCELPSGSVVANYTDGEITLSCRRIRDGRRVNPIWTIGNDSLESGTVRRKLTSNEDGVVVYCGTEDERKMVNFTLRVYRK